MPSVQQILKGAGELDFVANSGHLTAGTPGRTHFEDLDNPETIVRLATELADEGFSDEAMSVLDAFVAVYPDQRDRLEALLPESLRRG
jgi:hypothetical protein